MKRLLLRFSMLLAAAVAPVAAGAQWERIPGFDGRFFDEVFTTDASHMWAAESFTANIIYTTDGGQTWSTGTLPGAAGSKMRDLSFVDNRTGFATGSDGVFRSTNGGRTWTDITPRELGSIPAVWFRNASEGVLAYGTCDADQLLFMHTTDGGATWTETFYTTDMDASVGGVRYEGGVWYAAGGRGKIWTSFDGENWMLDNSGSGGWQEDIDVADGTIYTASTLGGSCELVSGGRLMVLPGGSSVWTYTDPATDYPFWGVSAISATEAWACGDKGNIYHTTNSGMVWNRLACGLDSVDHVDDIAFADATNGWAVGDGIWRYSGRVDILPVSVTPSVTVCVGESVELDASGGTVYTWSPAVGLSDPNIPNPIVTATTTTTYTVTVANERGCTGTATVVVNVAAKPEVSVADSALSICAGGSVQLQASGGTTYEWFPAAGLSNPRIANPIASPGASTTYRVVSSNGACSDTAEVRVSVGAPAVSLVLPHVTADVHDDNVALPIRSLGPLSQSACDAESMSVTLAMNGTLFFPRSVTRGTITRSEIVDGQRLVTITLDRAALAGSQDTVTTIIGNALLGNAIESPITIVAMTFNGSPVSPAFAAGTLTLTGVCMTDGRPRLLDPAAPGLNKVLRPTLR